MTQEADSFVSYKSYRNLVNRKLKEAQNQFSENSFKKFEASEETRKFIKKKLEKNSPNNSEIDENGQKHEGQKVICNAFNRVFSEMGIYRVEVVKLNVEQIELNFIEFNFSPLTMSEI